MSHWIRLAALLSCAVLLGAGCATGYHARSVFGAGFSEQKLAPGLWLVTFDASVFTPKDRLESYLLLRCAEVAMANRAGYFAVLDEGLGRSRTRKTMPTLIDQPPFPLDGSSAEPKTVSARSVRAEIQLYTEKPEEKVYDAKDLIARLQPSLPH